MANNFLEQDWYRALVDECKAIIAEAIFNSRWSLVEGYWNLGKRILEENDNFERRKIYGKKILSRVRESLNAERKENQPPISEVTLWRAIQFAREFPDLDELPGGKNVSWHKICNNLLPAPKDQKAKFEPELYNIWNFAKRDDNFGEEYFGQQTADLIMNLLWYFTEEEDLVWDVFAGGGLTSDVCQYMNRKCYSTDIKPTKKGIVKLDVTKQLPAIQPQLIFMDPPYWRQAEGKYSDKKTDFANMTLKDFYYQFELLFGSIHAVYDKFYLALLIQNTQWKNDKKVEPHGLKLANMMMKEYDFEHHIIVPYSTQQYNPQQVEIAKSEKLILQLHRDLLIFKK